MMPCPPQLEELCLSWIPYFTEAALVPHIPSLHTLQLYCRRKECLSVPKIAAMTALRSLDVRTSDQFAAIGDALPALVRLTHLSFESDVWLYSTDSSPPGSAAQSADLSLVLQKLSALPSLCYLSLSGTDCRHTQALGCEAVFPALEVLHLDCCTVDSNHGVFEFFGLQSRLANVRISDMVFVGTRPDMSAFRAAMARRIPAYLSVSVHKWICRAASGVDSSVVVAR